MTEGQVQHTSNWKNNEEEEEEAHYYLQPAAQKTKMLP